jgi:hypothetical protein
MENQPGTQPGGGEKAAPATHFSTPAQPAQQQFQPVDLEHLPGREPFRTTKPFAVGKLVLGSFNLVFAIIVLAVSIAVTLSSASWDNIVGLGICIAFVCPLFPPDRDHV